MSRVGTILFDRMQDAENTLLSNSGMGNNTRSAVLQSIKNLHRHWALHYHTLGTSGKLEIRATKSVGSKEDLSVAYSPGVAEPCLAIAKDPDTSFDYTSRGHLVGVVSNGTAVLGLGNIGALASKPVMEGKAVLFKNFGGVDSFDIELNET